MFRTLHERASALLHDRDGAVTVDFVVLTASVIIVFILIVTPLYDQTGIFVSQISDALVEYAGSFAD